MKTYNKIVSVFCVIAILVTLGVRSAIACDPQKDHAPYHLTNEQLDKTFNVKPETKMPDDNDNQLVIASPLTEGICSVCVRSTDSNGLYIERTFEITASMPTLESLILSIKSVDYSDVSFYWQNIMSVTSYQHEYRKETILNEKS